VLDRLAEPAMRAVRACPRKWRDRTRLWRVPLQDEETWKYERRILYKAEVTRHPNRDPKDNPRFLSPT